MTTIPTYLKAYNLVAALAWLSYLISWLASGFHFGSTQLFLLSIAQGMAVLEILHAATGWVKSPAGITAAQVASRLLVLVLIHLLYAFSPMSSIAQYGISLVSVTWSITEIVRYSYYYLQLRQQEIKIVSWLRYSLFIVFYPMGITGEWLIFSAPLFQAEPHIPFYVWGYAVNAILYIALFPKLYGYMWKQRQKKI